MSEPTAVALAEMGLLSRSEAIQTTIVGIGDHVRRRAYLDKFTEKNKDVKILCNVKWSADTGPTQAACRCNANLVLLELGARAAPEGQRQAINIPNTYILPRKALGDWSKLHLKATYSNYKGMTGCYLLNLRN